MAPDGADLRTTSEDAAGDGAASRAPSPAATSEAVQGDPLADVAVSDEPQPASEDPGSGDERREGEVSSEEGDTSRDGPAPEVDVEALSAKAQKADEYLELAQRTKADFENFRKRAARDASVARERGAAGLAKELLPAIDNLERALAAAQTAAQAAGEGDELHAQLLSGLELVHAGLISALDRSGITRFSPEGEPFDPTHHEAVAQQPVEGAEAGTIAEVYQRGYRIGESVLRPARVLVAG